MRELTIHELDKASGGLPVAPIISIAVSLIGIAARSKAIAHVAEIAGLGLAAYGLYQWANDNNDKEE